MTSTHDAPRGPSVRPGAVPSAHTRTWRSLGGGPPRVWDSADALARVAAELEPARKRLWERFGTNPPVALFDVADELR